MRETNNPLRDFWAATSPKWSVPTRRSTFGHVCSLGMAVGEMSGTEFTTLSPLGFQELRQPQHQWVLTLYVYRLATSCRMRSTQIAL
jgi:hypothetical protein